jgi:naphthoate synthase
MSNNGSGEYKDVTYELDGSTAVISINRPSRYNAFTGNTVEELIHAFKRAWADKKVRVAILTGVGDKAFCTGGDVKQRAETGDYGPTKSGIFEGEYLHRVIRDMPKPVIAAVNGLAIGGGHVLQVICDLSIASETARFGQAGPRVGSFDPGLGSAYLVRLVGERKAREIWYLCRQYSAAEALEMGLVNKVVPASELLTEAKQWATEIAAMSPTAIAFLKGLFGADSSNLVGLANVAYTGLQVFMDDQEATEGISALMDKRAPDFSPYVR